MRCSPIIPIFGAIAMILGACAASDVAPGTTAVQTSTVRRVLAEDVYAASIRDHQSDVDPPAQAVSEYVASLDGYDLSHAPADFAAAMRAHRDAWAALIDPLRAFSSDRAEMHDLFDRLKALPAPTGPEFQRLIGEVMSTWDDVVQAAKLAGVDP